MTCVAIGQTIKGCVPIRDGWRLLLSSLALLLAIASDNVVAGTPPLHWENQPNVRSAAVTVPPSDRIGFSLLAPAITGIEFTNFLSEARHLTNQILLNGSGVAAGDVDGDGWCDLFFCGLGRPSALYRNLGDWKFEDVSEGAGVRCADLMATGAALADLDGDGDLDLIVNSLGGGTRIFLNDGKGRFTQLTEVNSGKGGMSLALADIDGDGFLDIYIANYRTSALMDVPNARATFKMVDGKMAVERINGRRTTEPDLTNRFIVDASGGVEELGEPDLLLRNHGGTNFFAVSFTDGAFVDEQNQRLKAPPLDWGLSVMFRDINGDGLPDIYVCNDFNSPDRVWINTGNGRFRALPTLAMRKSSMFSMGVDFADINRDGRDDFVVLDMLSRDHRLRMTQLDSPPLGNVGAIDSRPQYGMNTLFLARGDGTFAEISQFSGLEASEWAWTPIFLDVDLDGWEDLLVSNGQERAARDLDGIERLKKLRSEKRMSDSEIFQARKVFPRLATPNQAFRNRGDLTFEEVGEKWGFAYHGVSHGMALADLDNDGDLDVVVNNFNERPGLYRNEGTLPRIGIRLKGTSPNTHGIGAKITVRGGPVPWQSQEMICGGRYLSSDDPMRVFAAGSLTNRLSVEVAWRNGRHSSAAGLLPNRIYEIDEKGSVSSN